MGIIGNEVIRYTSVDSTNNEAWRLMKSRSLKEGSIIRAEFQTAGKGQGGTSWESESDSNLNISIVLKPAYLAVSDQFFLNQAVAIALRDAIAEICRENTVKIKWPNDIYFENKKIAGVLIENSIMGSVMEVSVVGIGVNVNQLFFVSDAPNPVSLAQILGVKLDLDDCLNVLCNHFELWINILKNGRFELITNKYHDLLLGFGEQQQFISNNESFCAEICGVNHYGKLILKVNGIIKEYENKEIKFRF
jgi:BirA family transcriptional regulator, biotin operon repressor / biotin---[acetyl-CoA-carboxylase] ligase